MVFRSILVYTVGSILTILFFIPVPLVSIFDRKGNGAHLIGRAWARIILFLCGIEIDIKGLENLLTDRSQVLVSNHQEAFDILLLHAFLPIQFRWISKEKAFKYPFIGWAMSLAGYIKMDRSSPRAAYRALEEASRKLKEGLSILIFPEGGRSKADYINEFKRGPFLLAIRTRVPIVPISIRGTNMIIQRGWPWIYPVKVKVFIDKPVYTDGLQEREAGNLKGEIFKTVCRNFDKL